MKKLLASLFAAAILASCNYDDSGLWKKVDDHEARLKTIEAQLITMNSEVTTIKTLVQGISGGKTITNVTESATGYIVSFSDNTSIEIKHGTPAPVIGVAASEGVYYWNITANGVTRWLPDSDTPVMPVSGVTPVMGVDGDGYWTVDTGSGPTRVLSGGQPVEARGEEGDSLFDEVKQDEGSVTFVLADGTELTMPKSGALSLEIDGGRTATVYVEFGATEKLGVVATGVADYTIGKPDGWKVSWAGGELSITAPDAANTWADTEGQIAIVAVSESGASVIAKVNVKASGFHTVTFEGDYWEPFVAANFNGGATSTGSITGYDDTYSTYIPWVDAATSLSTEYPTIFNGDYGFGYDYAFIVSSFNSNDTATYGGYDNDLYVYNPANDNATTGGGNNGSDNFVIGYGYSDDSPMSMGDYRPVLMFADGTARVIKSLFVNSTTYFLNEARDGRGFSGPLGPDDKVWLEATGIDGEGNEVGTVRIDYASQGSFIEEWTKLDLSSLGAIVALKLNQGGVSGPYGYPLPAYYAVDDVTVVMEP